MKNLLVPSAMFLCLILFVSFANSSLLNLCDNITDNTIEIENMIRNKDFESANKVASDMINLINDNNVISSIYLNHSDLDCLMDEAAELLIYTECE